MRKKAIIIICICFLIGLSVSLMLILKNPSIPFPSDKTSKIVMTNGNNGRTTIVKDNEKVKLFYNLIDKAELSRASQENTTGWTYSVDMYSQNEVYKVVLLGDEIWIIDGTRYKVDKKNGKELLQLAINTEKTEY